MYCMCKWEGTGVRPHPPPYIDLRLHLLPAKIANFTNKLPIYLLLLIYTPPNPPPLPNPNTIPIGDNLLSSEPKANYTTPASNRPPLLVT